MIADDELDHLHLGSSSPAPRESLLQPALTAGTLAGTLTMRSGSWVISKAFSALIIYVSPFSRQSVSRRSHLHGKLLAV